MLEKEFEKTAREYATEGGGTDELFEQFEENLSLSFRESTRPKLAKMSKNLFKHAMRWTSRRFQLLTIAQYPIGEVEIKSLAREYGEKHYDIMNGSDLMADEAENVIRFLLDRYDIMRREDYK